MKFYTDCIVQRVRQDSRKGVSLRRLEQKFGIPNTTISRWVRDICSSHHRFQDARTQEQIDRSAHRHFVANLRITRNDAKLLASLLYWCEGSKYPSSNFVAFSNSDSMLVKTFLELLKYGFEVDPTRVRAHLQLHTTHDLYSAIRFWSKRLDIPMKQFYKPTITRPTRRMKRRDYLGTCTVKYFDVHLLLSMEGIFESFAKKFGEVPKWLKGGVC
ncbi:MAG: hypothetical protein HYZ73_01725 [Elusimicrobia bacterium]|nr:hypothetical protein [Elusimicrobiota bacterium]